MNSNNISNNIKLFIISYLPFRQQIQNSLLLSKDINHMFKDKYFITQDTDISINQHKDQLYYYIQYFNIFNELHTLDPHSPYCNRFFDIDITTIDIPNEMYQSTMQSVITDFINYISYKHPKYYLHINTSEEVKHQILILSKIINPQKYKYDCFSDIRYYNKQNIFSLSHADLFNYVQRFEPEYFFREFFDLCIDKMYDITIPFINIIPENIDQVIAYSTQFPNRVLTYHSCLDNIERNKEINLPKLYQFISLNIQSLRRLSECNEAKWYPICGNITQIYVTHTTIPLHTIQCNFNNIKKLHLDNSKDSKENMINFINKMPNLKYLAFPFEAEYTFKELVSICNQLNVPQLKEFRITMKTDYNEDLNFLFKRFPNLKKLTFDDNLSLSKDIYDFSDVYESQVVKFPLKQYEFLFRNRLKNYYKGLTFYFTTVSHDEFAQCYSSMNDIVSRIEFIRQSWDGLGTTSTLMIPYCKKYEAFPDLLRPIGHVDYVVVEPKDVNDSAVINWISNVNPYVINIKHKKKQTIDKDQVTALLSCKISNLRFVVCNDKLKMAMTGNKQLIELV